jgi:hypothetical protein
MRSPFASAFSGILARDRLSLHGRHSLARAGRLIRDDGRLEVVSLGRIARPLRGALAELVGLAALLRLLLALGTRVPWLARLRGRRGWPAI